jgi:N-acyl-D-amino-acid deacylase
VGLSTGLQYIPGLLADTAELTEISRPLADAHRPYVTHMRGYEQDSDDGMGEVFAIAAGSGAAVHVSHLHAPLPVLDPLLRRAADAGVDLTFDSYPYLSGFSLLTVPLLPWNLLRLTPEDLAEHLGAPGAVDRMPAGWADHVQGELDRITLAGVPGRSDLEGLSLREAAEVLHLSGPASVLHLIASTTGAATAVFRQPPSSNEESVRALLRRDEHLGGSDGIVVGGHPHPRAWATFPRFLARHVRDLGDWSWPDAAVHLSARPGVRFGLGGRGLLRPGAPADVILVDPDHVQDVATYGDPRRLSAGIADVWVAGERVLRDGELVGGPSADALPGRLLTWEDRT